MEKVIKDIISMMAIVKYFTGKDTLLEILEILQGLSINKIKQLDSVYISYNSPLYKIIINPICFSIWDRLPKNIEDNNINLIIATIVNVLSTNCYNNYDCNCKINIIKSFIYNFEEVDSLINDSSVKLNFKIPENEKFYSYGYRKMVKEIKDPVVKRLIKLVEQYEEKKLNKPLPPKKKRSDKAGEKYADKIIKEISSIDPFFNHI